IGTHEAYILDEPFNDVDIIGNVIMKKEITKLKESGKIVLLSSHILSSLTDICDEILLLCEGEFKKSFQKEEYDFIENHLLNL
ncbi:MAG: ABC transporter ATP-binding protein, partial [Candidatus Nephrothrix sp. EaCA]